jgi:ABC-type spermidine/putrescine transport system permease subunit II
LNSLSVAISLAVVMPILGLVASVVIWRRWKAPWPAKVVMVLAVMGLMVPATCGGLLTLGEVSGLLKPPRF